MSNTTKRALEESLKKLLLSKPLDKITINDLTTDCGISRMTFYYHFQDIYDLAERTYDTWQEGLEQIFEVVLKNKPFITNVYHSVSKEKIENYLYKLTYELIIGVVEEKSKGTGLSEENKSFIADFHKYGFVGLMLDWIKQGMKEDYHEIVERMSVMLHGNITNSIQNFEQNKKG